MTISIPLVTFRKNMPDILERSRLLGQHTLITRNNKPLALIVPVEDGVDETPDAEQAIKNGVATHA